MRSKIFCILILLIALIYVPAKADGQFVLYDDFNSNFMDVTKWTSSDSRGSGVVLLETVREIHGGRLHLAARAFGNTAQYQNPPSNPLNLGTRSADVNAGFGTPGLGAIEPFSSLKVSVKVKEAEATGCPDYNLSPTYARVRLIAFFFNAGITQGSQQRVDDVLAQIRIQRPSNSIKKAQVLEVWFDVYRCTNVDCSTASTDGLESIQLGEINLGQWATIQIDWDKENRVFYGKLNNGEFASIKIPDSWNLNSVKGGLWNALGASNRLAASCPVEERAMAYVYAEFDNLYVK